MIPIVLAPVAGLVALLAAAVIAQGILKSKVTDAKMVEISNAIKQGAMAFMNRQYRTILFVALAIVAVLLAVAFFGPADKKVEWLWTTAGFTICDSRGRGANVAGWTRSQSSSLSSNCRRLSKVSWASGAGACWIPRLKLSLNDAVTYI